MSANAKNGMAIAARSTAVKRLIDNHIDEFNTLHGEERVKAGLAANPEDAKLKARYEVLSKQMAELREKMDARGMSVSV